MKALILIDLQNDFFSDGALAVNNAEEIIPVANKLIKKFDFVVATLDWHPKNHCSFKIWPKHCVQDEFGSKLHEDISPIENLIYKGTEVDVDSYSGFFDNNRKKMTELDSLLKKNNIDTLYMMGLATDFCVKFTVLDALKLGYKVYVIKDGCKGVRDTYVAYRDMKEAGATLIYSSDL